MENIRKILKKLSVRKCLIYSLTYSLILNTSLPSVFALEGGDVINSTGVINTSWGNNTVINTNHGAIINWNNFNTSSIQSVTFNQYKNGNLSSNSAVLNRISSGGVPTQFDGVLNANGRVFIVNPAGIIFGKGSSINANQLIASSLDMTNSNFLDEHYEFIAGKDNIGAVVNNGSITATEGIAMIGRKVLNAGTITTGREGFVVMTAGDRVILKEPGSSIIVQMDSVTLPDNIHVEGIGDVINERTGEIISPAGTIILAAGDIFTIAMELDSKAARIVNGIGVVEQNGIIHADGINGDGGSINLLAGQDIVLTEGSFTTANAGTNGIGGQVILYSNGTTFVGEGAMIMALGGTESGGGGFVEISGNHFGISGEINASATNGLPGTLLIDPLDVTIANGSNQGQLDTWYEVDIEHNSQAGTNVLIEAERSITVQNILDNEITGGSGNITLRTTEPDSLISFLDKSDTISTTMGGIIIESGSGGVDIGSLITAKGFSNGNIVPGQITLTTTNGGDITAENLSIEAGLGYAEIYVNASGNLTINGNVSVGKEGAAILNLPNRFYADAIINLIAGGDVVLNGDVGAYAHGTYNLSSGGMTWSYITIRTGDGQTPAGTITINGDLTAEAKGLVNGTSRGIIQIDALNDIYYGSDVAAPSASADQAHVESFETARDSDNGNIAKIIINGNINFNPEPEPEPEPIPPLQPDPEPEPEIKTKDVFMVAAPLPEKVELEFSGCQALMNWAADELGIDAKKMQIRTTYEMASIKEIQPCEMCARLKKTAMVLQDAEGIYTAALAQVINEFASNTAPPSGEQMASIANAIATNIDVGSHYATSGKYLDALAEYVGILNSEMNYSAEESIMFAADNYISRLGGIENRSVADFLAARLVALGG